MIVLLDEDDEEEDLGMVFRDLIRKTQIKNLKTSSNLTMNKTPFVLVKEFENIRLAQEYINSYKADMKYWMNIKTIKFIQLVKQSQNFNRINFEEYKSFFIDFY